MYSLDGAHLTVNIVRSMYLSKFSLGVSHPHIIQYIIYPFPSSSTDPPQRKGVYVYGEHFELFEYSQSSYFILLPWPLVPQYTLSLVFHPSSLRLAANEGP
jgi:hypothetical protein